MARKPLLGLLGTLALVAACSSTPAATPTPEPTPAPTPTPTMAPMADWPDQLILGLVPSREADVLVESAKPLTDHLSQVLSDEAGRTITVTGFVPQDYTGLVSAMETAQAEIGAFGPFSMLQAVDRAGAVMILQSDRFGSTSYHAQLFTNDPDKYCSDNARRGRQRLAELQRHPRRDHGSRRCPIRSARSSPARRSPSWSRPLPPATSSPPRSSRMPASTLRPTSTRSSPAATTPRSSPSATARPRSA